MADYMLAGEGAIWIQPDGPNTQPQYLGCHEMGDVSEGVGDIKLFYCPDPSAPNKWKVVGSFQGEPGPVTSSIATDMNKTGDYLERQRCPFPLYVLKKSCGKKSTFGGWDRAFVLENTYITKRGMSKLTAKEPASQDRTVMTFDITAETMERYWEYTAYRYAISDTEDVNSINICGDDMCEGDCGDSTWKGKTALIGTGLLGGSAGNIANVWKTIDGGLSWGTPTFPFPAAIEIATVACVEVSKTVTRLIAVRGTTAVNVNTVRISDDNGASWINSPLPVTALYGLGPKCLCVIDYYNIWLCTSGGYIFYSADGATSWTAQSSASLTTQNLYALRMLDNLRGWCGGANNTILRTEDGESWYVVTGPAGQAAVTINGVSGRIGIRKTWLAFNDGKLYFTKDEGATWTQRVWGSLSGTGSIASMDWYDELFGAFVHNTAALVGTLWFTINGGFDWHNVPMPTSTNAGLNDVLTVDTHLIYVVGNTYAGSGYIVGVEALH